MGQRSTKNIWGTRWDKHNGDQAEEERLHPPAATQLWTETKHELEKKMRKTKDAK